MHTAQGALKFVLPLLDAVEHKLAVKASVRIDAGFPEESRPPAESHTSGSRRV